MAKAIAIARNRTKEIASLTLSAAVAVILLGLVSLLIGGVISPLRPEW